jgi:hypothetical protein
MRRMCHFVSSFLALLVCLAAVATAAHAQTRDKYVVSAKAGGINFVAGNVTVVRRGRDTQQTLTDKDNLERGDVVTTGMDGRVEVLLNPGAYLRVAENSEFELADTSLESLRVRLLRGSAIIEAVGGDGTELRLTAETPQTSATIIKHGIYRINVLPTGMTEVLVLKGRVVVGMTAETVKDGRKILIGNGRVEVARLDKKNRDSFDLWSRDRAEYLASLNRTIPSYLINSSFSDFDLDRLLGNYRRPFGIWFRTTANCYVFVPTYYGGWSSPYGYSYPSGYRRCCGNGNTGQQPGGQEEQPGGYEGGRRNRPSNPTTSQPGSGSGGTGSGGGGSASQPNPEPVAPPRPEPPAPAPAPAPAPSIERPAPVERVAPVRIEAPVRDNPNQ